MPGFPVLYYLVKTSVGRVIAPYSIGQRTTANPTGQGRVFVVILGDWSVVDCLWRKKVLNICKLQLRVI